MSGPHASGLDVWCVRIDPAPALARELSVLLDEEELDRARRFVQRADALRYRVAHGALRSILAGYTDVEPRRIRLRRGEHGKPALVGGGPSFSLSHSGGLALVAVCAEGDVGVDVEAVRAIADAPALAAQYFSPERARHIAGAPPARRDLRFLRTWTAMEAVLKADGSGLTDDLRGFELRDTGGQRAVARFAGGRQGPTWSVYRLELPGDHVGAVATRAAGLAPHLRHFSTSASRPAAVS